MSEFNDEIRVDAEELLELVTAVFERCGMSQADATLLADSLVDADLCSTHSHESPTKCSFPGQNSETTSCCANEP